MFIRKTHSKNFTYLNLVRTYREDKKVKHENIASLGRLDLLQKDDQLKSIALSLLSFSTSPTCVLDDSSQVDEFLNWGFELVFRFLFEKFQLPSFFRQKNLKIKFDLVEVVFSLVLQRLAKPSSKLAATRFQSQFHRVGKFDLQHAYRSLDHLAKMKDDLESHLFKVQKEVFGMSVDIVFYDVTTFYFESQKPDDLKEFGYSKDHKFGEVQVVAGLLIDQNARPISFEIFKGNTFEGHTMLTMLKKLKERFNIGRVIIVADRGMQSKMNLLEIKKAGFNYIVGARLASLNSDLKKQILDLSNYQNILKTDDEHLKSYSFKRKIPVKYQDADHKNINIVLEEKIFCTWSLRRAKKDALDRERLVEKAKKLDGKPVESAKKRGFLKYLKKTKAASSTFIFDQATVDKEQKWDGLYGIATSDLNLSRDDALKAYRTLWKIEQSFRVMKTDLRIRPIFHWTPKRIEGHFVLCLIAYAIERNLEKMLHDKKIFLSFVKIRETLWSLNYAQINVNNSSILIRTSINQDAKNILSTLGIKSPQNTSIK